MDYTRHFVEDHGNRGVLVARGTVERFWAKAVKKRFEADEKKKRFHLRLVRTMALFFACELLKGRFSGSGRSGKDKERLDVEKRFLF